uniref:RING-type domain-containing protein n=1 Tax=Chelonoidis abingdonii TaxID=106734 RepID=A0A8C0GEY3_CHEAB
CASQGGGFTASPGRVHASAPERLFQDKVTCSICLEYFTDPVTIECGHNFCWACISQSWGESEPNFSCPQCRETSQQRNLWPNRQLGNVVELVKRLRLQAVTEPEGQRVCESPRALRNETGSAGTVASSPCLSTPGKSGLSHSPAHPVTRGARHFGVHIY